MKAGIEIGGTFTDLVLVDPQGNLRIEKVLTTPNDLTDGALAGLEQLVNNADCDVSSLTDLLHGSTIATNALIERKGAAVGLISTAGFEDVLLIGRQERDDAHDMFYQRPPALMRRRAIRGVFERLGVDGSVVRALDANQTAKIITELVEVEGIESLAVCLLHAYRNPSHEQAVAEISAKLYPDLEITLSSELAPEHREYERTSTTVLSAYVRPVVRQYLQRLEHRLGEAGINRPALIMQSNGGVLPAATIAEQPARMYLSGPAAGVTGAAYLARRCDAENLITMDVGGTSCDVSLVTHGDPHMNTRAAGEFRVHDQPLNLVMMDIFTLGAGGGSVAWEDAGGMLRVGPQSAGATPGPACYDRGGDEFTLTDALFMLGLIDPNPFIEGGVPLNPDAPERVSTPLAQRFQLMKMDLARAVHQIAISNIAQALRLRTVERGKDPRDYALCPYGGAGPLLATHVAEELGISRIVVPPVPGVFSAFGLCVADMRMDFVRALPGLEVSDDTVHAIEAAFSQLRSEAQSAFVGVGDADHELRFSHFADARYFGQGYELRIAVDVHQLAARRAIHITEAFHDGHKVQYGHDFPQRVVELVNLRVVAERVQARDFLNSPMNSESQVPRHRHVQLEEPGLNWPVFDRLALAPQWHHTGPLLIDEKTSTTVVPKGWSATLGPFGVIDITRGR